MTSYVKKIISLLPLIAVGIVFWFVVDTLISITIQEKAVRDNVINLLIFITIMIAIICNILANAIKNKGDER